MSFKRLYHEIFEEFDNAKTREERITVLRKHGDERFREFLNYAFNTNIKFDVDTVPQYRPAPEPEGLTFSTIDNEMKRLYVFVPNHPKYKGKLEPKKQAQIAVTMLQSVHAKEALLLVGMFKKVLSVKFLTPKIIKEAFPDIPLTIE